MSTSNLFVTVIQKIGTDISLQTDLKSIIRQILIGCGITTGNFTVNIMAPSDNTLPARTVIIRSADVRAIQVRASGYKTGTWNVALSGPNNLGVFNSISRKSAKRHFSYDDNHNIVSGFNQEAPPAAPDTQTQLAQQPVLPVPTVETNLRRDRFSITKNPEHLVLALSYIAEACDSNGSVGFRKICQVINANFAEEGQEISEAKIRPAVTAFLVDREYLKVVSTVPTVYTLTPSGVRLLELNSAIKPEVKGRFKSEVVKGPATVTSIPVSSSQPVQLEAKLIELQTQIGRHDELQARGAALVEMRNTILARKQNLERELAGIPEEMRRVEVEIEVINKEITDLAAAKERYDQIMRLLA